MTLELFLPHKSAFLAEATFIHELQLHSIQEKFPSNLSEYTIFYSKCIPSYDLRIMQCKGQKFSTPEQNINTVKY